VFKGRSKGTGRKSEAHFEKTVVALEENGTCWNPPDKFPSRLLKPIEYDEEELAEIKEI